MAISNTSSGFRPGVCTSTTRPTAPFNGQVIYETDTKQTLVWQGSVWVMLTDADQPPGLQLIKSQAVGTGVSSVTVTDAFSANYKNYRIIYSGGISSIGDTTLNFRHETVLSTYFGVGTFTSWVFSGGQLNKNGTNEGIPVGLCSTNNTTVVFDVIEPFEAQFTKIASQTSVSDNYSGLYTGVMKTAASYSQFILSPVAGTFTGGTIRVYGYRN